MLDGARSGASFSASTGPSSGDDGEQPGRSSRAVRELVASTGPSSGDDGEAGSCPYESPSRCPRFNGAVVWRRRREHGLWRSVGRAYITLQRGRRLETTERPSRPRSWSSAARCFNGAVVWRRRRAATLGASGTTTRRALQRGRRLETTERAGGGSSRARPTASASTGPSSGDDGEPRGYRPQRHARTAASTGPSSGDDGESTTSSLRKGGMSSPLQRGRRLETTESA